MNLKIAQLLTVLLVGGYISSAYTENSSIKHMYNTQTKQIINKVTTNNTSTNNDSEKQLSTTEQLDKKIEYINGLVKSIYNKDKELNNIIQSFKQSYKEKYGFESSKSICYDLKQKLFKEAIEYSEAHNTEGYEKRITQERLVDTIFELEEISLVLQKLKGTEVFPKLVDFVRSNSEDLLNGKVVDFSSVFTKTVKDEVNNSLREVCYADEVEHNKWLKKCGFAETSTDINSLNSLNSLDLIKIQVLLMYEALELCPELKVEHVLKLNSKGKLINGVQINNSNYVYGFIFNNNLKLGISKTFYLK